MTSDENGQLATSVKTFETSTECVDCNEYSSSENHGDADVHATNSGNTDNTIAGESPSTTLIPSPALDTECSECDFDSTLRSELVVSQVEINTEDVSLLHFSESTTGSFASESKNENNGSVDQTVTTESDVQLFFESLPTTRAIDDSTRGGDSFTVSSPRSDRGDSKIEHDGASPTESLVATTITENPDASFTVQFPELTTTVTLTDDDGIETTYTRVIVITRTLAELAVTTTSDPVTSSKAAMYGDGDVVKGVDEIHEEDVVNGDEDLSPQLDVNTDGGETSVPSATVDTQQLFEGGGKVNIPPTYALWVLGVISIVF